MVSILKRMDPFAFFGLTGFALLGLLVLGRAPGGGNLLVPPWDEVANIAFFGGLAVPDGFWLARRSPVPMLRAGHARRRGG